MAELVCKLIILLCPLISRKLYWTDGDNISMANMDGNNHTILFTSQKGPVGELAYNLMGEKSLRYRRSVCMILLILPLRPLN